MYGRYYRLSSATLQIKSHSARNVEGEVAESVATLPDPATGVYGISVAADMVGTGVQNLRAYERAGLVEPSRTAGGTRLYSTDDIERLRRIAALLDDGLNLVAIAMVLDLQDVSDRLRRENAAFRRRAQR